MNRPLEERLQAHLGNEEMYEPAGTDNLTHVRQRARRRSMRTRVAVGLCSLAALAGIGSLIPTGDESNSLIIATEPTTTPLPTVQQLEDTAQESEFVDPPVFLNLVSDGLGGFVGVDTFGTSTMQFLRSDDGENWRLAETWEIPEGTRFETLTFADGLFVAQLERPKPDTSEFGLLADPLLAISSDLQSWEYVELELEPAETVAGTPQQQVKYQIDSFVRNGDKLAMLVHTVPQFDPTTYDLVQSQICGQIDRPSGVTLVLCDGSFRELPPGHAARSPLNTEPRAFVSEGGARAVALDLDVPPLDLFDILGSGHGLIADGDGFRVLTPGTTINSLLPPELLDSRFNATFVSAHDGADGRTVIVAEFGQDLVPLQMTKDDESFDIVAGSFPSSAMLSPASEMGVLPLGYGPAGWVVALTSIDAAFTLIERDGWSLGSTAGSPSAVVRSADTQQTIVYEVNSNGLPPHVHVSLFGGIRYLHPETGELLVELSASEALIPEPWATIQDEFGVDHTLVVDGWELSGNPVAGPLALTSPDGDVREFADGFAFDNDDISDGVETDFSNRSFVQGTLYGAGGIVFYDDQGNELVTIESRDIIAEFITPVVDESDHFEALVSDPFAMQPVFVLYSPDGIAWTELPAANDLADPFVQSLAIGDDEAVTGLIPNELLRVPLDQ